jgi:hypothetical protein
MKRLLLAATALAAIALSGMVSAKATVIDDPLHIYCVGCVKTNIGGNDIIALSPDGSSNFSFTSSPNSLSGNLQLKVLIPDTYSLLFATSIATADGLTLFGGGTIWNVGQLDTFLGFGATPTNPVDAFTGAASASTGTSVDGFYVGTLSLGAFTAVGPGETPTSFFSLAEFCTGCLIGGNLFLSNGDIVATANSSFGVQPVPGPIVGAGIPGLIAALGGMVGLQRFRRKRRVQA